MADTGERVRCRCAFSEALGHAVEPEMHYPERCSRRRFHLGDHDIRGFAVGRWWLWQSPTIRLSNLRWRVVAALAGDPDG